MRIGGQQLMMQEKCVLERVDPQAILDIENSLRVTSAYIALVIYVYHFVQRPAMYILVPGAVSTPEPMQVLCAIHPTRIFA